MGYYDEIAEGYDELYLEEQKEKLGLIRGYIKGRVLDVGSGTCVVARSIENEVVSLDPSGRLLKKGKGERVTGKAEDLPFEDNSFDTVISLTALHHCDIDAALSEIERVIKKNGVIVISFFKKSPKFEDFEEKVKYWKRIDAGKDVIFIRTC